MRLELWKAFMSASFLYHYYSPEAVFITGAHHLVPGSCMLFFHISLHVSPANKSPRKLITKSTNYTEQHSWLPADSLIHWTTQACYFFKCCTSVVLDGCATLFLILICYFILTSFDSLVGVQCLSCCQSVWGYFNSYQKTKCSSHSFHLSSLLKNLLFH